MCPHDAIFPLISEGVDTVDLEICNGLINNMETSFDTTIAINSILQSSGNPLLSFGNSLGKVLRK
jgi:hypothetical protein